MSLHIGALFHWTPKRNRESILKHGLQLLRPCSDGTDMEFAYICFATTPSSAWALLPVNPKTSEDEDWDLWQVELKDTDWIEIRSDFVPYVREVRLMQSMPPDRIWWVGERCAYAHSSLPRKVKAPLPRKDVTLRRKNKHD